MAFIWNTQPNPPSTDLPVPVPPGEITYEQREVANLVNAGGTLSYNTPNVGFDILYELPTANATVANFTNCTFNNITVNTANITTATINLANIQTANILSANIMYGYVGSDPTSNLGIASKHYADAAAANVPTGGSDLQNLIDAKGDLLVGTGFHTATRLPKGSNGQILIADSTANTGLRWITVAGQELFYNLLIQTHYEPSGNDHQVILRFAGEIVMNDGTRTAGWLNKIADIEVSGPGGLDTGVEEASHWYEVHAIRNSSNGNTALLLHRTEEILLDQSLTTASDTGVTLGRVTGGTATRIAQSFVPVLAGPLTSTELEISKTGAPTGLMWVTVEADSGGFPSGTPLATSRAMDVARLPTDKARIRFLFDANTSVDIGTTYHIVYQADYTATPSDTNYTTIWGVASSGYVNGSTREFRVAWFSSTSLGGAADLWFKTFVKSTPITAVSMPAGYDQRCLISYVYNDSGMKFKQYAQKNRMMALSMSADWKCFTSLTGLVEAVDLSAFVPPVPCSVQFYSRLNIGGPKRNNPIGGPACTDLPISDTASGGQQTANTSASDTNTISTCGQYGIIVLEEPVILTRMQNVDARLYTTMILF
jgi:hypothetical protein